METLNLIQHKVIEILSPGVYMFHSIEFSGVHLHFYNFRKQANILCIY